MKRREFVVAGVAGIGVVGLGGTIAHASPTATPASDLPGSAVQSQSSAPEGVTASGSVQPNRSAELDASRREAEVGLRALLAPLAAGAAVASSTLESVRVDEWGTGEVVLRDASGAHFRVDVCSRDESARATRVGATEQYDLFLRNGGDGGKRTDAAHAESVSVLAAVIRSNERSVASVGLVAKSAYWRPEFWERA